MGSAGKVIKLLVGKIISTSIEFSLDGDGFCRFYRITRKTKKIQ